MHAKEGEANSNPKLAKFKPLGSIQTMMVALFWFCPL
jgi:hypothetical protein